MFYDPNLCFLTHEWFAVSRAGIILWGTQDLPSAVERKASSLFTIDIMPRSWLEGRVVY